MPVTYNETKGKWCMGSQCDYDTKEKAEAAERAYHANLDKSNINICNTTLAKSVDEEKRLFTSIVLKSNYRDSDGVNEDFWPEEVVEQAAHDFMVFCQKHDIQHQFDTDAIRVVESYIAPCQFEMGGSIVDKNDWVMTVKFFDDHLWQMAKDGIFNGFSVACAAIVEEEG